MSSYFRVGFETLQKNSLPKKTKKNNQQTMHFQPILGRVTWKFWKVSQLETLSLLESSNLPPPKRRSKLQTKNQGHHMSSRSLSIFLYIYIYLYYIHVSFRGCRYSPKVLSYFSVRCIHPPKTNGWNAKMVVSKRNLLFLGCSMLVFGGVLGGSSQLVNG